MATRAEIEALLQEQLTPLRGRFKEVAIRLEAPEGVEVVEGKDLLDPAFLAEQVRRFGERNGISEQRIAGVHWLGQVGYAILPPIELAMTRAGIGLDASLENVALLQPNGQPAEVLIHSLERTVVLPERYSGALPIEEVGQPVDSAAELRRFVVEGLFGNFFKPLIERIRGFTGVSAQAIWGQVSYEADLFYQQLARVAPEARDATWVDDQSTLFGRHDWTVDGGANPLYGPTKTIATTDPSTGEPTTRTLRTYCCLIFKEPGKRMCSSCPLAPKREIVKEKLDTVIERRAERARAS